MLGLLSALGWGLGDFVAKRTVEKIGPYVTLFYMFSVGTVLLGLITLLPLGKEAPLDPPLLLLNFLAAVLGVLGYFFLYYGFKIGALSVVSTLTAAGTIVPVALSLIILKEWPTSAQFIGIGLVITGVILVSIKPNRVVTTSGQKETLGVLPALLSAIFFGTYIIFIKIVSVKSGPILPIFIVRGMGVVLIGGALLYRKEIKYPPKEVRTSLLGIGILDALAFLAFTAGINKTLVAIVSPLSSLFTLVTVTLAHFILKEQLELHQKWGFWMVLLGVLILSATS